MKFALAAVALISATSALAETAPMAPAAAPAAKPAFSTGDSNIGTLLDNPRTKAVLDKVMPGFSTNPQVEMARGFTLRQVQQFAPDQLTDALLAKVDAELAAIPSG